MNNMDIKIIAFIKALKENPELAGSIIRDVTGKDVGPVNLVDCDIEENIDSFTFIMHFEDSEGHNYKMGIRGTYDDETIDSLPA